MTEKDRVKFTWVIAIGVNLIGWGGFGLGFLLGMMVP